MLIGFHLGIPATDQAIMSAIRRRLGAGGNTYVPRERYSLTMSFCVVPVSVLRGAPCSSATATYSASSHIAGALIVIGVVAGLRGEVEGHREPGLTLRQVAPVERVAGSGRGMPCVRADHPWPV